MGAEQLMGLCTQIKKKRGHFLQVASTMGYAGICHQSDYAASKHGILGMVRDSKPEYA